MSYSQALKQVRAWSVACTRRYDSVTGFGSKRQWSVLANDKFDKFARSELGCWALFTADHEPDHLIARTIRDGSEHVRRNG